MLLIHSIQQLLPSDEIRLTTFQRWKRIGIHRVFRLMKNLQSNNLQQEVDSYNDIELKLHDKQFRSELIPEISYGPQVKS